ncbi:hypothetical protein PVAND_011930 [Polypedilum vanderplanki]|uniref:Uncharacterized protein n=1 Tax=Polypedilum vanderplanki TaxID=319348 RepID=A0A9J6CK26_POLVA|nr:hypothetical protein PVAND_011930 [Polypedilum vanderplanki]
MSVDRTFLILFIITNSISFTLSLNVYREIAKTTGYINDFQRRNELENVLKRLRNEIDFDIVDAFDNDNNPVRYKGCEPLIVSYNPVKCDANNDNYSND